MIFLTVLCLALLGALIYVLRQAGAERDRLVQRIQAPDRPLRTDAKGPRTKPRVIDADDDVAYNKALEEAG